MLRAHWKENGDGRGEKKIIGKKMARYFPIFAIDCNGNYFLAIETIFRTKNII